MVRIARGCSTRGAFIAQTPPVISSIRNYLKFVVQITLF
jgi:hypothetical protein